MVQAQEAFDKAVQRALMADGMQRLKALQEKERTMPSLFVIPEPVNSAGCRMSSTVCRRSWQLCALANPCG